MKTLLNIKIILVTVIALTSMILASCSDDTSSPSDTISNYGEDSPYKHGEHIKIPKEILGDPEMFDQPRISFICDYVKRRDNDTNFCSMKIDGTDLRIAADESLFEQQGTGFHHLPSRSPDYRYVMVSQNCKPERKRIGACRNLIDLKEKTATTIAFGGVVPHFYWSSDSKRVMFYLNDSLLEYNTVTKETIEKPMIYSMGYFYLEDDKHYMAINDYGYSIYENDGTFVKEVILGNKIFKRHALSPNKQFLQYGLKDKMYVINLKKPLFPIFSQESAPFHATFSHDSKFLFYKDDGILYKLDLSSIETTKLKMPSHTYITSISQVNHEGF